MSVTTDARPTLSSTNVLIVDDHDLVAMSLALCLRSEGMHAQRHAARSRDGILIAVATLVPGVVLLDLDLGRGPDGEPIDGTTLVAGLCRNGWRVIVLSAAPTRVAENLLVDLPADRDQLTTRADARFAELRGAVYAQIQKVKTGRTQP